MASMEFEEAEADLGVPVREDATCHERATVVKT
jgi:hypothetical protein